jgi:DNA-binding transcriptional regulator YiaG
MSNKFAVRIATNGKRTKEWTFETSEEALEFAQKMVHIGDAQYGRALISPDEIASLRKNLNMTLREFSEHVGAKNHATIHEWESGKFIPRLDMQQKLISLTKERAKGV